jgi:hypothetical protein
MRINQYKFQNNKPECFELILLNDLSEIFMNNRVK